MRNEKHPGIRDIAKTLNISATTVMKALRGLPKISEETRRRVLKEAKRVGYQPDLRAQALAGRGRRFVLVSGYSACEYMADVDRGLEQAVQDLSAFDVSKCTSFNDMFMYCHELETIYVDEGFTISGNLISDVRSETISSSID